MSSPHSFKARGALLAAAAAVSVLSAAGCRTPAPAAGGGTAANAPAPAPAANPAGRYKVTAESTSFFRLGPGQPNGPDLALKKGARLTLLRRGFGYSQVQLEDGSAGFVGTEDVARLTPEEIAAETKPLFPGPNVKPGGANVKPGGIPRRRGRPDPNNIPIAPPDEPGLPSAADPTPRSGPVPTFRY